MKPGNDCRRRALNWESSTNTFDVQVTFSLGAAI